MASADFSAPVFHHRWRLWPFRVDAEISGNKVQVFPPAGRGFTTLLRLGFGLRLSLQACPQVGLVSAFCSCPPRFASGFLRPRPHGRKFAISSLVPPNWPIGDFHSSPVSCPTYKARGASLPERALTSEPILEKTANVRVRFHHRPFGLSP